MIARIGVVAVAITAAAAIAVPLASNATAARSRDPHSVRAGTALAGRQSITSPNGRYVARVTRAGRLVVTSGSTVVWRSFGPRGAAAQVRLRTSGNLVLRSGSKLLWSAATAGSHAHTLRLTNAGRLVLRSSGGTVWASDVGNRCRPGSLTAQRVVVDLSEQFATLCNGDSQVLTTPITSGASAYGAGTPTGTWYLQGKQRDRYLYPAAGGAYYVHYWMPYDGAYGMHDSSWQDFPYGSARYRTEGSHGCVHFPRAAIAWMFDWAPIGTMVRIRR